MDGMRREAEREFQRLLLRDQPTIPKHERRKLARKLVAEAMQNLVSKIALHEGQRVLRGKRNVETPTGLVNG